MFNLKLVKDTSIYFFRTIYEKVKVSYSVQWGINPTSKTPPILFLAKPLPPKSANCPSPFLGNPPYILVFRDPPTPLKLGFFREPPKI